MPTEDKDPLAWRNQLEMLNKKRLQGLEIEIHTAAWTWNKLDEDWAKKILKALPADGRTGLTRKQLLRIEPLPHEKHLIPDLTLKPLKQDDLIHHDEYSDTYRLSYFGRQVLDTITEWETPEHPIAIGDVVGVLTVNRHGDNGYPLPVDGHEINKWAIDQLAPGQRGKSLEIQEKELERRERTKNLKAAQREM